MTNISRKAAFFPVVLTFFGAAFTGPTQAGVLHKHPVAAGVGAGLIAHHMAKKSAAKGGHGLMARHPKATGVAAGMAVHHMLKK